MSAIFSLDSLRLQLSSSSSDLSFCNKSHEDHNVTTKNECDVLRIETINLVSPPEFENSLTKSLTTCSEKSVTTDESYIKTQPQSFEVDEVHDIPSHITRSESTISTHFSCSRQRKRIQRYYTQQTKSSPCASPAVAPMLGPGSVSKSFSLHSSRQDLFSPWLSSPENSLDHSDSSDTAAQASYWSHSLYDEPPTNTESGGLRGNTGNVFSISEHDPLHIDIVDLPTFCASDAAPLTSIRSDRDSGCSSGCWWSPDPKRAASKYCPTHTPVRRHHTATGRQQHSLQRALHLNSSLSEGGPLMSLPSSSSSSASSSLLLSPASGRHPKPAWSDDSFRHADSRVGPPGSCSKEGTLDGCKRQQLLTQLLVAAPDQFPFSGSADGLACIAEEVHEETRSGSKLFDVGDDDDGQHRNGHDKCDDCGGDGDILKN
mmetsp:Transcript_9383/g.12977  ORF Transcript_9383/g.12977 Transcript_9383/m.12977 type:complete len:430 (+) Transcript_9383:415-1704(+)